MITPPTFPMRPMNGGNLESTFAIIPPWARAYEPKANGYRITVHVPTMTCFNRHGERLTSAGDYRQALLTLRDCHGQFTWLDCEGLSRRHGVGKGCLMVLDIMDDGDLLEYETRRALIEKCFNPLPEAWIALHQAGDFHDSVWHLPKWPAMAKTNYWPDGRWAQLKKDNQTLGLTGEHAFWEGLVCKRLESKYTRQLADSKRESSNWIKHRFI